MDEKDLRNLINKGKKNILFQKFNKYKNNIRFDYDEFVIKEFRKKFPEEVKKLEEEVKKRLKYLRYKSYKKFLDKKVDKMIFPSVLERPDGYFYLVKDKNKKKGKTWGGYHEQLSEDIEKKENSFTGGVIIMNEIIDDILDQLTLEENTIIKMYYGINPYKPSSNIEIFNCLNNEEKEKFNLKNLEKVEIEEKMDEIIKNILNKIKKLIKGQINE